MSGGISATTLAVAGAAAAGGLLLANSMGGKTPTAADVPQPTAPPQAAQAPAPGVLRRQNQTVEGAPGTTGGTLLTGPGGVDASLLNLGKSTLLGQ